jgi:hypothetical protein
MVTKVRGRQGYGPTPLSPVRDHRDFSIAGFLDADQSQVGDPLKMLQVAREQRQPVRRRDTADEVVAHSDGQPDSAQIAAHLGRQLSGLAVER